MVNLHVQHLFFVFVHFFAVVLHDNVTHYSSSEKMRNASGHQGRLRGTRKNREHAVFFLAPISFKQAILVSNLHVQHLFFVFVHFFAIVLHDNVTHYSSGEKMRNASGHQGRLRGARKNREPKFETLKNYKKIWKNAMTEIFSHR